MNFINIDQPLFPVNPTNLPQYAWENFEDHLVLVDDLEDLFSVVGQKRGPLYPIEEMPNKRQRTGVRVNVTMSSRGKKGATWEISCTKPTVIHKCRKITATFDQPLPEGYSLVASTGQNQAYIISQTENTRRVPDIDINQSRTGTVEILPTNTNNCVYVLYVHRVSKVNSLLPVSISVISRTYNFTTDIFNWNTTTTKDHKVESKRSYTEQNRVPENVAPEETIIYFADEIFDDQNLYHPAENTEPIDEILHILDDDELLHFDLLF